MDAKINELGFLKNKDLHLTHFDRAGCAHYHTRPMPPGLPDLVDCVLLAGEAAVLERSYALHELQRLKDLLADSQGEAFGHLSFVKLPTGQPGARVMVRATPSLVCQRCMQDFAFALTSVSDVEFAPDDAVAPGSTGEFFRMQNGLVSLRELVEEELLLALPIAPACQTPMTCGKAPSCVSGESTGDEAGVMRRPFSALQDLLKKT